MLSKLNIDKIIKEYIDDIKISDSDKAEKVNEESVLLKFKNYADLIGENIFSFSYEDFINFFNYNKWFTPSVFGNRKCIILRFLDYCSQSGYCTEQYKHDFSVRFKPSDVKADSLYETEIYESFEIFNNLINKIINTIDGITYDNYCMVIGTLYLIWYGFSLEEIVEIPNDSFDYNTGLIYTHYKSNKSIIIQDPTVKSFMEQLRTNSFVMSIKSRKKIDSNNKDEKNQYDNTSNTSSTWYRSYYNNGYLIKSTQKKDITVPTLRCRISNFSKLTKELSITDPDYMRVITYKGVYTSGLYNRIHHLEEQLEKELSHDTLEEFDIYLNGELLNGVDSKDIVKSAKAHRIIREYNDYKQYLASRA